jgi:hypothetical protein
MKEEVGEVERWRGGEVVGTAYADLDADAVVVVATSG